MGDILATIWALFLATGMTVGIFFMFLLIMGLILAIKGLAEMIRS